MPVMPKDTRFDSTIALLKEGYNFIPNRRRAYKSDIFETRLMLQKAICLGGTEAAAVFYDNAHFIRQGATPKRVQKTLTGQHGIQSLDDDMHQRRKALFMSLMGEESRQRLMGRVETHWQLYSQNWQQKKHIVLFEEMQELLFRAACDWTGVPYNENDVVPCARDLTATIDGFGGIGLRHWRGRMARKRMERWARQHIENARIHQTENPTNPLGLFAHYHENHGTLLDSKVAAVELLNVIRPIVAIATYATFIAHALHTHPECRQKLQHIEGYTEQFVQEVRRYYPFTPFVGARVRDAFKWNGYFFPKGQLVILDIYGMNHDPRYWNKPERFIPERFHNRPEDPYSFMPQGGGNHYTNHRCAGEWVTIDVMKLIARHFATMNYNIPSQDLTIDSGRIPTRPASGVIMEDIRYEQPLQIRHAA